MGTNEIIKSEQVAVGSTVLEVLRSGGSGWVAIKPLCEALKLDVSAQRKRVSGAAWAVEAVIAATGADGKTYDMQCLRADCMGMFFATIDLRRHKDPDIKARLVELQREATQALDRWFRGPDAAPAHPVPAPRLSGGDDKLSMTIATMRGMLEFGLKLQEFEANQQQVAAGVAQANQQSQTALAKVDRILADQQAADLAMEPLRQPTVMAPDITTQIEVNRICRRYGFLTGQYNTPWNILHRNHRDLYHQDIKQLAENAAMSPAEMVTKLGRWEHMYALAVKYLVPEIERREAARAAARDRTYNA